MNNKNIEIILNSLQEEEIVDYVVDTFYKPMESLKNTVARGLKIMKKPLTNEDLQKIKSSFMQYEMIVDRNLSLEKDVIEKIVGNEFVSTQLIIQIKELHDKESSLVHILESLVEVSEETCQIYELLLQVVYKSQDRIDVINHYIKQNNG